MKKISKNVNVKKIANSTLLSADLRLLVARVDAVTRRLHLIDSSIHRLNHWCHLHHRLDLSRNKPICYFCLCCVGECANALNFRCSAPLHCCNTLPLKKWQNVTPMTLLNDNNLYHLPLFNLVKIVRYYDKLVFTTKNSIYRT